MKSPIFKIVSMNLQNSVDEKLIFRGTMFSSLRTLRFISILLEVADMILVFLPYGWYSNLNGFGDENGAKYINISLLEEI